jgi:hypothetical protein
MAQSEQIGGMDGSKGMAGKMERVGGQNRSAHMQRRFNEEERTAAKGWQGKQKERLC